MKASSIVLVRSRTLWFIASMLALVPLAGCFKSPDVARILCTGDTSCPAAYRCAIPIGSTQGACMKTVTPFDGGGPDTTPAPALADGATPLDTTIDRSNGSLDQGPASAFDTSAETGDLPVATDSGVASDVQPDIVPSDAPMDTVIPVLDAADAFISDLPIQTPEVGPTPDTTPGPDMPLACTGACCSNSDCPGTCQTCSASHTCVSAVNADDPNGRCVGTCDATGTCKSKKGQACTAVATGCVSGTACSPEGICCDKACAGSCEACDIGGALGTCTTLGSGALPHSGHIACVATSTECAGKCNGTSNACFYTTASCGTASCGGANYTPPGTCSAGACVPGTAQACPTNQTCSGTACACLTPYITCGGSNCLDPRGDTRNCGTCGHDCLGGACGTGLCQPAVVVSGLAAYASIFGVDASYVYYSNCTDAYTCDATRVDKTAVNGTGSVLKSGVARGFGVIGNTLFLNRNMQPAFLCTVGGACDPSDSSIWVTINGMFGNFKSPSPQYYSNFDVSGNSATISWYTTSNALVTKYSVTYQANGADSFSAYGSSVYWIQSNTDGSGNPTGRVLYGTNGFPVPTVSQLASVAQNIVVVDVNAQSVILMNAATNNLYRVPLPGGLGTGSPQQITGATGTKAVTEDASGIYWIDSIGALSKCAAPACTGGTVKASNVAMASVGGGLFQDSTALYWVSSQGQLLRLAK